MIIDELLMSIGAIIIVVSWLPQMIKLLRTKSSKDISIPFLAIIITGTLLIIPHSIIINDIYFTLLNSCAASIAFIVLLLAIKYRKGVKK
ncbi:MAG: PQ-loop domain-containing transporter [Candidatus Aenigmarchaeota archaeon]|nr:PQ-loop domain-containing transporter [Candidatus Aenigmarchaeota archaeon]